MRAREATPHPKMSQLSRATRLNKGGCSRQDCIRNQESEQHAFVPLTKVESVQWSLRQVTLKPLTFQPKVIPCSHRKRQRTCDLAVGASAQGLRFWLQD